MFGWCKQVPVLLLVQLGASIVVGVVVLCYVVLLNARLFVGAFGCLYFCRCKYLVMK